MTYRLILPFTDTLRRYNIAQLFYAMDNQRPQL
ncbi:hypothetical protein DESC_810079 [Desulfosarcina cetonica]|nr:hypothetical protein DESC_810079 [Desulfosarcina cetonica]